MDDDAAVFVTGNRARVENNVIADSLHGIYLKKIFGAQILSNRIQGKTTLIASSESVERTIGSSSENCDTTLVSNRRGNGIHQWNCEANLIRGNEISDTRDGIYFSFTNDSRVENNLVHHTRYGLHYMYSDGNTFENNTFTENAAGAAIMFSKELVVRGNRFVNNRGHRAYGLIFQSSDRSTLEGNEITENAVGLSFNQCNANKIVGNRVMQNYIGLRFGSNSDDNQFTRKYFRAQPSSRRNRRLRRFRHALVGERCREFVGRRLRGGPGSRRHQRFAPSRTRLVWRLAARFSRGRISFR